MKLKKGCVLFIVAIIMLTQGEITTKAMTTGFFLESMKSEKQQVFLENINLNLLEEEPTKTSIECFDVSEDNLIAIGTGAFIEKKIAVYTLNGEFKYGYTFQCNGSFGLEWDGDNIIIYFVRSDVAASFDSKGNCLELSKIENSYKNTSYWRYILDTKKREVGENQYIIRNNMGPLNLFAASSYSQLVVIDSSGNKEVIYDVSKRKLIITLICWMAVALFVTFVIVNVVKTITKMQQESLLRQNHNHNP